MKQKRIIFASMLFFLTLLVVLLLRAGYRNWVREDALQNVNNEIANDEKEIQFLTLRAKWWETPASRVFLKKINWDVKLPGERVTVLIPEKNQNYSIEESISAAKIQEEKAQELTIPEKWRRLFKLSR